MKKKKAKKPVEEAEQPVPLGAEPKIENGVDLVFVVDGTASMGQFLVSLASSFVQIISIAQVTKAFERIRVVVYHDYCDPKVTRWSPWATSWAELQEFVISLKPSVNLIFSHLVNRSQGSFKNYRRIIFIYL